MQIKQNYVSTRCCNDVTRDFPVICVKLPENDLIFLFSFASFTLPFILHLHFLIWTCSFSTFHPPPLFIASPSHPFPTTQWGDVNDGLCVISCAIWCMRVGVCEWGREEQRRGGGPEIQKVNGISGRVAQLEQQHTAQFICCWRFRWHVVCVCVCVSTLTRCVFYLSRSQTCPPPRPHSWFFSVSHLSTIRRLKVHMMEGWSCLLWMNTVGQNKRGEKVDGVWSEEAFGKWVNRLVLCISFVCQ